MTVSRPPRTSGRTIRLQEAAAEFLTEVMRRKPGCRARYGELLEALDAHLGAPAPLLAYTRLTGEGWLRSLPGDDREAGAELLTEFRAHLRDWGWLDAARPVNLPD